MKNKILILILVTILGVGINIKKIEKSNSGILITFRDNTGYYYEF